MASALQPLRLSARRCTCREGVLRNIAAPGSSRKALSTTSRRWAEPTSSSSSTTKKGGVDVDESRKKLAQGEESIAKLLDSISKKAQGMGRILTPSEFASLGHAPPVMEKQKKKRPKDTLLNLGDPDPWEEDGQLEDGHDDITSLGHGELEQHREMRHYARLTAWEMPLLADLAKPFEPPTAEMPLRFRYTSYMGEQHPAEKKVVLEFSPADMPNLTDVQREKLKKLVGSRYNPDTDVVRMSSDSYETQAQNKRYLGDLVDTLLHEARTGDTFEDVPLDLRHHRVKPKPKFPAEWIMTPERKAQLEQLRMAELQQTQQQQIAGSTNTVDGTSVITEGITQASMTRRAEPELVTAGRGKAKVSVRR